MVASIPIVHIVKNSIIFVLCYIYCLYLSCFFKFNIMRKYFVLLLVLMLCSQHLVYGQRGYDSLPKTTTHIKFGDPIRFNAIEGAELYRFMFSLYGNIDTIQTMTSYINVSEYAGMPLFETYYEYDY